MTRQQNSYFRDLTFHVYRRKLGSNIPATDLDFLEYDNFQPVDLREFKNDKSKWREGKRTASIRATYNLAKKANIPFYIIEHNDNYSNLCLCKVIDIKGTIPITEDQKMTLPQYIENLYKSRGRELPEGMNLPLSFNAITPTGLIIELFLEMEEKNKSEVPFLLNFLNLRFGSLK